MKPDATNCPCSPERPLADCCGRYLDAGELPATAEQLMRSRYSAYALGREAYLLASWHASTRPKSLNLGDGAPSRWIGLKIVRFEAIDGGNAVVEFVARYKVGGKAHRLHEVSRFIREQGRWFYVDGVVE